MSTEANQPANSSPGKRIAAYVLTIPLMLVVWIFLLQILSQAAISLTLVFGAEPEHIGMSIYTVAVGHTIAGVIGAIFSFWSLRMAGKGRVLAAPIVQIVALGAGIGIVMLAGLLIPDAPR